MGADLRDQGADAARAAGARAGASGASAGFTLDELGALQDKAKQSGFFGVQTPEEYGGMGLGAVMARADRDRARSDVRAVQVRRRRRQHPVRRQRRAEGAPTSGPRSRATRHSCFAITEPGAGSDARNIRTSAVRDGDEWVINGEKTFITGGDVADFAMVFAVTDKEQGRRRRCDLLPRRPRGGLDLRDDPDHGRVGPGVAVLPGRARAALGDPRRGGSRLRAGDALDRQGPLPAAGAGARRRASGWSRWRWSRPRTGSPSASRSPTGRPSSG